MSRHACTLLTIAVTLSVAADAHARKLKVPSKDYPTIQHAIDDAEDGDVIDVKKGYYAERLEILVDTITLRSKGAVIDAEYKGDCITILRDDVTVDGFILANGLNGLVAEAHGTTVINCDVYSARERGMDIRGNGAVIAKNTIRGGMGSAIYVEASQHTTTTRIEGNAMAYNPNGIGIDGEGGRFLISKNHFEVTDNAIELEPSHPSERSIIEKNRFETVDGDAIHVDYASAAGVVIRGNQVQNCADDGIQVVLNNVFGVEIVDNRLYDMDYSGIDVDITGIAGVVVEGNDVRRTNDGGIDVVGDGVYIHANRVENSENEGIDYEGDLGIIDGNRVRGTATEGIEVGSSNLGGTTVSNNDVQLTGRDGIRIIDGDQNVVSDNKVSHAYGDGIQINAGTGSSVLRNRCTDNAHEGIDNSGVNTIIDDNVVKNNAGRAGPDIAGAGMTGVGSVASFSGNVFGSGGATVAQRLDHDQP